MRPRFARSDLRPSAFRRAILRHVEQRLAGTDVIDGLGLTGQLGALLEAEIKSALPALGLGLRFADPRRPELDMASRFKAILEIELYPIMLELASYFRDHGNKHRRPTVLFKRVVRRFESEAQVRERKLAGICGRLQRRLIEALE